ncbi:BTB domain-containing protein [Mycena sanguinolenta]|uniref:BTB domain-containing protein n=1 Tax=Mycena sanguinolenta TaxID=230812 RepID=A0A8H6Z4V9_9AGAR|nr:BTB domain-containing protein [Mycena sanguinolenta]
MVSPPAKRQRTEFSEDVPTKRSELWFSDGSVILQAVDTQFRVHWSLLARHSSVFGDMQKLPQPSDEPTVDGCPVVKLPDDPMDVELLLKGLYDSAFLGRKYQFEDVLDAAVARVTAKYPTTLAEYDATTDFGTIEGYDGIEFDMVTLLSENNIFTALPSAYYRAVNNASMVNMQFPPKLEMRCV